MLQRVEGREVLWLRRSGDRSQLGNLAGPDGKRGLHPPHGGRQGLIYCTYRIGQMK